MPPVTDVFLSTLLSVKVASWYPDAGVTVHVEVVPLLTVEVQVTVPLPPVTDPVAVYV